MIDLFHRSYGIPLIACLYRERGAKFVTLVSRLGASRDTVSLTIGHLVRLGLVVKNPGHGHPMRPEYILTAAGEKLGPSCDGMVMAVAELDLEGIAFKKWVIPVATAIGLGADRFSALTSVLGQVTPRALTGALRDLDARDVVCREITSGWPPHPRYVLGGSGTILMPTMDKLRVAAMNA